MNNSFSFISINELLEVCIKRRNLFYLILNNTQHPKFQKYLYNVISQNHLCFRNIHFTVSQNYDCVKYFKKFNELKLTSKPNEDFDIYSFDFLLESCLVNEKACRLIFERSLQGKLPVLLQLIVKHELKCINSSIKFLQNFQKN